MYLHPVDGKKYYILLPWDKNGNEFKTNFSLALPVVFPLHFCSQYYANPPSLDSPTDWWSGRTTLFCIFQSFFCQHGIETFKGKEEEYLLSIPTPTVPQVNLNNSFPELFISNVKREQEQQEIKKFPQKNTTVSMYAILQGNLFQNVIEIHIQVKSQIFWSFLTMWGLHYLYLIVQVYYFPPIRRVPLESTETVPDIRSRLRPCAMPSTDSEDDEEDKHEFRHDPTAILTTDYDSSLTTSSCSTSSKKTHLIPTPSSSPDYVELPSFVSCLEVPSMCDDLPNKTLTSRLCRQ